MLASLITTRRGRSRSYSGSQPRLTQNTSPLLASTFSSVLISPFMKSTCVIPILLCDHACTHCPPNSSINPANKPFWFEPVRLFTSRKNTHPSSIPGSLGGGVVSCTQATCCRGGVWCQLTFLGDMFGRFSGDRREDFAGEGGDPDVEL